MATVIPKGAQTEIGRKIEELAGKVPAPLSWLMPDPYHDPTGGFGLPSMPMVGMTREAMAAPLIKSLFKEAGETALSTAHRKGLADALRVIARAPRKVVDELKKLEFPAGRYYNKYEPDKMGGWFSWDHTRGSTADRVNQKIILKPIQAKESLTPATTLAHEIGHGAATEILGRIKGDPVTKFSGFETIKGHEWEGIAEYLGERLSSGLKTHRPPIFPYGEIQQKSYETLSKMGSPNPYMNVMRYLQQLLKK